MTHLKSAKSTEKASPNGSSIFSINDVTKSLSWIGFDPIGVKKERFWKKEEEEMKKAKQQRRGVSSSITPNAIDKLKFETGLPERTIRQGSIAFDAFDLDHNGVISKDELKSSLIALGENVTETKLAAMMNKFDPNGDGVIDFTEFLRMINKIAVNRQEKNSDKSGIESMEDMVSAFVALGGNHDKSGTVSMNKVQPMFDSFGLEFDFEDELFDYDKFLAVFSANAEEKHNNRKKWRKTISRSMSMKPSFMKQY